MPLFRFTEICVSVPVYHVEAPTLEAARELFKKDAPDSDSEEVLKNCLARIEEVQSRREDFGQKVWIDHDVEEELYNYR